MTELDGSRFHLIILQTDGKLMSNINKIIKFGDNEPYTPYSISPIVSYIPNNLNYQTENESEVVEKQEIFAKNEEEEDDVGFPSPYGNVEKSKVKYVTNKEEMEDIEVRGKCENDNEISKLDEKVNRSLWNEFKKGYLTLDLKVVN